MEKETAISICMQHMHRYVLVQMNDGMMHDGIVEHVDEEHLYLAVPISGEETESRAFFGGAFFSAYGTGFGFGYPHFYPYGYIPRRRFFRRVLPLGGLMGLTLLPYY